MTIAELIAQLNQFNPNLRVVVRGYEDGWQMVKNCEIIHVVNDPHVAWYSGDYQRPYDEEDESEAVVHIVGAKSINWQGRANEPSQNS